MTAILSLAVPILGCGCTSLRSSAPLTEAERNYSVQAVKEDLDEFVSIVESTHPNLAYSTDPNRISNVYMSIRARLTEPMSARRVWVEFARLNPVFQDAHVGVRYPVSEFQAFEKQGGRSFPIPISVERDATIRVADNVCPQLQVKPYETILEVNGIATHRILEDLLPLMRGESEGLQRFVLSFNFPAYFWSFYGPADDYVIVVADEYGHERTEQISQAPECEHRRSSKDLFRYAVIDDTTGYIEVKSFDRRFQDDFRFFLEDAFASIRASRHDNLIIDIRENPGGAHELSDQLLGYLTDKPVAPASMLTARIVADNRELSPGAEIGDVVTVPFAEWVEPSDNTDRFAGNVFVLVSEKTYSQAIVFAVTVQDHHIGTIVGEPTGGHANQTGQVQMTALSNTALIVACPIYIIYRPSGDRNPGGLQPDIRIPHDPMAPEAMIDSLTRILRQPEAVPPS